MTVPTFAVSFLDDMLCMYVSAFYCTWERPQEEGKAEGPAGVQGAEMAAGWVAAQAVGCTAAAEGQLKSISGIELALMWQCLFLCDQML